MKTVTIAVACLAILMATAESPAQAPNLCGLPKASESAKLIQLGAFQTDALSTVALGSQDEVTGVGNVVVEPGEGSLYVVITSYRSTIWRFHGAIERVEHVVVSTTRYLNDKITQNPLPLAGIVGLPAERVTFPQRANCMPIFFTPSSPAAATVADFLRAATGRTPDVIAGQNSVGSFNVPSGRIESAGEPPTDTQFQQNDVTYLAKRDGNGLRFIKLDRNPEIQFALFNSGGIVAVDAKKVIASVSAEPYDVMPQEAGLIQLIKSGALTQNENGGFRINKKIRLPAGLTGAHRVTFLLRRGVPAPDGDPGHSKVISEETGVELKMESAR